MKAKTFLLFALLFVPLLMDGTDPMPLCRGSRTCSVVAAPLFVDGDPLPICGPNTRQRCGP